MVLAVGSIRWCSIIIARIRTIITIAQHFHFIADNIVCGTFDTIFTGIFTALNFALNKDLATFTQILAGYFTQFTEQSNIMPFSTRLAFSITVTPLFISSQKEIRYSFTIGYISCLGSRPRRPTRITLLTDIYASITISSSSICLSSSCKNF